MGLVSRRFMTWAFAPSLFAMLSQRRPWTTVRNQISSFSDNTDFSRNPIGHFIAPHIFAPRDMRFLNIIPEKFPPYSIRRNGPRCADLNDLSRLCDIHWNSSYYFVPILEEQPFRDMFQQFLSKQADHQVVPENNDGAPSIVKGILFAVAAFSAKYNLETELAQSYYEFARIAISAWPKSASFEYLLANTFLVCSFPTSSTYYSR